MAQLPAGAFESQFYKMLNASLMSEFGYGNVRSFFEREFLNYFPDAKWRELFDVAEENRSGKYTQVIGKNNRPVMASYVAFDADGHLISRKGFEVSSKDMPVSKLAMNFNEQSVDNSEYLQMNGGRILTGPIANNFLVDSTNLLAGIHTLRSYTGLQIESTGKYVSTKKNNGGGAEGLEYNFIGDYEASNMKGAGGYGTRGKKVAWSDESASPIGDLMDMVKFARDNGFIVGMFRMNENTYNQLIEHPNTKQQVAAWRTQGMILKENMADYIITDDVMQAYIKSLRLPPISVENWTAFHQCLDPETQKMMEKPLTAFADNMVVLRPAGKIGTIQWKRVTNLFSTVDNPLYYAENGLVAIQQVVESKQRFMQFTAESHSLPVPDNINNFLYLKTNEADS